MPRENSYIQDKIFEIMLICTISISLIFLLISFLLDMALIHHIKWFFFVLISSTLAYFNHRHRCSHKVRHISFILLIYVILPLGWLSNATNSPFSIGYVFIILMSVSYFYTGKQRFLFITSIIIEATLLMAYQILFPTHFITYNSLELFINTIIHVPLTLIISVYMLSKFADSLRRNNTILENLSTHDEITGIYNRRYIYQLLDHIKDISSTKNPTLIGLIDIDKFKAINDTYGHNKGDKTLIEIANHFTNTLQYHGVVGRYGGDEFIIIFENCNSKPCVKLIDQLSELSSVNHRLNIHNPLTISGGFAIFDNKKSLDDIIALADKRLYKAKKNGRNQIII